MPPALGPELDVAGVDRFAHLASRSLLARPPRPRCQSRSPSGRRTPRTTRARALYGRCLSFCALFGQEPDAIGPGPARTSENPLKPKFGDQALPEGGRISYAVRVAVD